jgi:hypothetical protein
MTEDCYHDKVHGPQMPTLSPAGMQQIPWICRRCLAVGIDEEAVNFDEFDELHRQRRAESER